MRAVTKLLAGGAAIAAFACAAPAAAQYYPGYGYPGYGSGYGYPYGGNVVGQVVNSVLGGGYGYGANSQTVVNQCMGAVQQRLNGRSYGYGYGGGYGGHVLGVTRVEPRESGRGIRVWGTASSGVSGPYGYNQAGDLTWSCRTDYRGYVVDVDIKRGAYGYGYAPYNNYDYSQYGYRRY